MLKRFTDWVINIPISTRRRWNLVLGLLFLVNWILLATHLL